MQIKNYIKKETAAKFSLYQGYTLNYVKEGKSKKIVAMYTVNK